MSGMQADCPEGSWEESITAGTLSQVLNHIPVLSFKAAFGCGGSPALSPCDAVAEGIADRGGMGPLRGPGQLNIFHQRILNFFSKLKQRLWPIACGRGENKRCW